MMLKADMDQLVEYSESVLRGRVVSLDAHWLAGPNSIIVTDVGFEVDEVWEGSKQQPGQQISIRVTGGIVGTIGMYQEHEPEFQLADDVILFLNTRTDGLWGIPHGEQGVYRVHQNSVTGHIPELKTLEIFPEALDSAKSNHGRP